MGDALRPMRALADVSPFDSAGYAYEVKWDGVRCLAHCERGQTHLFARSGAALDALFPELSDLHQRLGAGLPAVLDGELIIPDERGHPDTLALQRRMESGPGGSPRATYCVFDVLTWEGRSVTARPWADRRALLARAMPRSQPYACVSEAFEQEGVALYEAVRERGLEGIVAKRLDSPYLPGEVSSAWREIRSALVSEFVIGGYTISGGRRFKDFATLLLGAYEQPGGALRFVGEIAGGFQDDLRELLRELEARHQAASPFDEPPPARALTFFVRPELVAEVRYAGWSPARHLRFAVFSRLRRDVSPQDCRFDTSHLVPNLSE